ncbi:hypothetical protein SBOR_8412 [Sclerotinia borealis F-4128]|uniref:RING-type domain-containing protein n=1 Tax=Sclerotinia borealis (strain F-4128) TaxID=1432307 RepID=W9C9G2_SCLBF|nr:hypothetical protein SBOR_8412 [Sclerotinia borealis F-4128]
MALVNGMVETLKIIGRQNTIEPASTAATSTSMSSSTATPTPSPGSTSNNSSPTSSPLLFFVALGFGVVFTNLWIIVGVKYCFRYNARNRAMRAGGEVDPINLENMPVRPHRRRREKKLMTMDEVNERFPLTKYKNWVANRASEGLPTSGGVTSPPSRAASVVEVEGVEPSSPIGTKHSINTRPASTTSNRDEVTASSPTHTLRGGFGDRKSMDATIVEQQAVTMEEPKEELHHLEEVQTRASTVDNKNIVVVEEVEDDDEDDHIHTAVLPELLNNPGDSCAICIDTLEEDDDVRGLTCGHAFHAGCLDPWLTSRRACCPLCKADYFTPKPRPEGEPEPERHPRRAHASRVNMPQPPQSAWIGIRSMPGRFRASARSNADTSTRDDRNARRTRQAQDGPTSVAADGGVPEVNIAPATSRWRPRMPAAFTGIRMPGSNRAAGNASSQPTNAEPSPSQLEAGHRFA